LFASRHARRLGRGHQWLPTCLTFDHSGRPGYTV